jgi:hypothetical protein
MTKRRTGYYVERAMRRHFGLPEPTREEMLADCMRRALKRLDEREAKKNRPFCSVQTRAGGQCRNRVVLKPDNSHDGCCHVHAGLPLNSL